MFYLVCLVVAALVGCASPTLTPSPSDVEGEGCATPLGFIPEGQSRTGYLHPVETSVQCQSGQLTCSGGAWSGAFIYPSCVRGVP